MHPLGVPLQITDDRVDLAERDSQAAHEVILARRAAVPTWGGDPTLEARGVPQSPFCPEFARISIRQSRDGAGGTNAEPARVRASHRGRTVSAVHPALVHRRSRDTEDLLHHTG